MSSYWLEALVGQELVRGSEKVETSSCEGKHVALYFSAHWCPPCKQFTPMLAELYKKLQPSGTGLEIVYVSLDKTPDEFKAYFATMPWLAVPPERQDIKGALPSKYGIMGIPSLLVFSPEGELLTNAGVAAVRGDPEGARFPWKGQKNSWLTLLPALIQGILIVYMIQMAIRYFFVKPKEAEAAP